MLELDVKSGILANTTNIWINIHKTTLARDQTDKNIEFNNYTNFVYHSDKPTALQNELIPIINKGYLSKSESHQTLKELLLNNDFKEVYDQIYLILPLNLDHAIKNKRKIFLDSHQQLLIYIKEG